MPTIRDCGFYSIYHEVFSYLAPDTLQPKGPAAQRLRTPSGRESGIRE